MKLKNGKLLLLGLAVLGLLIPCSGQAADFVQVTMSPAQITFSSFVGNINVVMTVSGPDEYFLSQEFGSSFSLSINTPEGPLADGQYNYELRAEPSLSDDLRDALEQARSSGDYTIVDQLRLLGRLPSEAILQSGTFRIANGALVLSGGDLNEGEIIDSDVPLEDIPHYDDVIITGSLCVGFDCVNGEDFSYDTIRLKEHNLRIKFDDTSTAASYPRNDWQITANSSANGGQAKYSIDDITGGRTPFTIEAGAPSHALYVDDGGRVGFGTSIPSVELHTIDGDSPTLRLQQDGSSGFAPQTWDLAGNEANFFVRDVTNGSNLPFRIKPGAPSSSIFIASDGDVGLGDASPDCPLHVVRSGASGDLLILENDDPARFALTNTASSGEDTWRFNHANNGGLRIAVEDGDVEFKLEQDGTLTLDGGLVTGTPSGTCNPGPCDGIFAPEYEVESIEEHATYMWENSYLWGVGPTREGESMNITQKTAGILHELEKAHIYIEQLNDGLRTQQDINEKLNDNSRAQQAIIKELRARLAKLEAAE